MPFGMVCVRFTPWFHGEDPDAWEAHRAAVVEDVKPVGVLELALAEQIASKLWRLGRVIRIVTSLIGNAQDPEQHGSPHEKPRKRARSTGV